MLPFLAGLAVGSALTILYAKREDVKKAINSPAFKDKIKETKRLSQQALSDVKDKMNSLFTNFKGENPTQKPKKATNPKNKSTEAKTTPSKRGRKKKSTTSESVAVPKTTATRTRATKTTAKKSTAKKSTTKRATRTKKASPNPTTTPTSEIAGAN